MNNISSTISEYTASIFNKPVTMAEKICSFISNNRYLLLGATALVGGTILYFKFRNSSQTPSQKNQPSDQNSNDTNLEQTATEAKKIADRYRSNYGPTASTRLKKDIETTNPETPKKQRTTMFGAYCLVMNNQPDTSSQYEISDEYRHDLGGLLK